MTLPPSTSTVIRWASLSAVRTSASSIFAEKPFVGRGYVYGHVRPYGCYVVPRFGVAYDPFWYGPVWAP